MENSLTLRQIVNGTSPPIDDQSSFSFTSWLASYWFILLIVLAILVVVSVLICACVLKKHPRSHSFYPRPRVPTNSNSPDQGGSSERSHQSSIPTIPSLSADSTPIPSPHSSQHSMAYYNGRNRRTSPHFSSTSSDTLRPDIRSESSNSSASLMGHSPTRQQERGSPMERRGSLPRRTHSGPMVRVTSMPDVKNNGGLRPSPSQVSVESSSNGKSGVSYKFMPAHNSNAFVEVGVTVHTPGDPDKAVRIATAAALAESARKLAQEAASFIDNGDESVIVPPLPLSSSNRPYHPGSGRSSSFSQSSYTSTRSHVPMTTASVDNNSSSISERMAGNSVRGGHYTTSPQYTPHPLSREPNYDTIEEPLNYDRRGDVLYNPQFQRTRSLSFQRGRPRRSSLDNYRHEDLYPAHTPPGRERLSSLRNTRDTLYSSSNNRHNHLPSSSVAESSFYSPSPRTQRLTSESTYSRGIPYHLTAAGRQQQQSTGGFDRRGGTRMIERNHLPLRTPKQPHHIQVPVEMEDVQYRENPTGASYGSGTDAPATINKKKKSITSAHHHPSDVAMTTNITMATNSPMHVLPQSPSTSTSLSSTHSSQMEFSPPQAPSPPIENYNGNCIDSSGSTIASINDSIRPLETSIESSQSVDSKPDGNQVNENHAPVDNHAPKDLDMISSSFNSESVDITKHSNRKTNETSLTNDIPQSEAEAVSIPVSGSRLSHSNHSSLSKHRNQQHVGSGIKLRNLSHLAQSKTPFHSIATPPSPSQLMSSPNVTVNV